MNCLDRDQWEKVLDRAGEHPSFGAVVAAVEDVEIVEADAEDLVEGAIDSFGDQQERAIELRSEYEISD